MPKVVIVPRVNMDNLDHMTVTSVVSNAIVINDYIFSWEVENGYNKSSKAD